MFYSLLKQGFSPVSPSKRASRISRSEVPACYPSEIFLHDVKIAPYYQKNGTKIAIL